MTDLKANEIENVGVVGSGQMGAGIAQVFAQAGYFVKLVDVSPENLNKAQAGIEKSLTKLYEKGSLSEHPPVISKRIRTGTALTALNECQFVVEAVSENESLKKEIFSSLNKILSPNSVIASNTSSLPITQLAVHSGRPLKFIGMHFMNPVPLMSLVEIIRGHQTSPETLAVTLELVKKLGKESVSSQDFPGFIVNRVLMPMINEAFFALMEGIASAEDIDKGMKLGTNQPMGPLTLADFIGLDTCLAILEVMHKGLGDPKYRPSPLLKKYVAAGEFGKKTKKGVFVY